MFNGSLGCIILSTLNFNSTEKLTVFQIDSTSARRLACFDKTKRMLAHSDKFSPQLYKISNFPSSLIYLGVCSLTQ